MPAELPPLHDFLGGDVPQRTLPAGQAAGYVGGVVAVVLPPLAPQAGQFGGIGDIEPRHTTPEAVEEPLEQNPPPQRP